MRDMKMDPQYTVICVDGMYYQIYIYNSRAVCYSIDVERENTPTERTPR